MWTYQVWTFILEQGGLWDVREVAVDASDGSGIFPDEVESDIYGEIDNGKQGHNTYFLLSRHVQGAKLVLKTREISHDFSDF